MYNQKGQEIYDNIKTGNIICGVKNTDFKINIMNLDIRFPWLLIIGLTIISNFGVNSMELLILLAIYLIAENLLLGVNKISFKEDKMVIKNLCGLTKEFNITYYPRIHVKKHLVRRRNRYRYSKHFYMFIQQYDTRIKIRISGLNAQKVEHLINNLMIKRQNECSENDWIKSANKNEWYYYKYKDYLEKQGKIMGVKEKQNEIKIDNSGKTKSNLYGSLMLTFILILILTLGNMSENLEQAFLIMTVFSIVATFYKFILFVDKKNEATLKISCSTNGEIKINKYKLQYERVNIRIMMEQYKEKEHLEKLYEEKEYTMLISTDKNTYKIKINEKIMDEEIIRKIY